MDALVSIIIPVYNLEDYIGNCINSIISQTYKNLEIICINDGSTDMSSDKIMAIKDDRIKLINQKNAGVSAARNVGLREATGDYIMFVDGDDYLHFQAVEILIACAEKTNCDIACSREIITNKIDEKMDRIINYSSVEANNEYIFSYVDGSVIAKSVWAKLYKYNIAMQASFPEDIYNGEDGYYNISIMKNNPSIQVIDCKLYYYCRRENSAVTSGFTLKKFSTTYSFDRICEFMKDYDNTFLKRYSLQYLFQSIFYNRTLSICTEYEKIICDECKRIGKKWMKAFLKEKGISIEIRIMFFCFFHSRLLYEFARAVKDPTMKDFYKSRKRKD